MSSKKSDLPQWYAAQYEAAVGLAGLEGGARFNRLVATFPAESTHKGMPFPMVGKQRMSNFLSLKMRYPLGPAGYSCFAMTATVGAVTTNYAYAYWRRGASADAPEYICVAPTFESRDGEYRGRFIRYPVFMAAFEEQASSFAPFEEAVLGMMAGGSLRLSAGAYPPSATERLLERTIESRLQIIAFTMALVLDLWEIDRGLLMVHTSKAYVDLMQAIAAERASLVDAGLKRTANLTVFYRGAADALQVQCGQKLVPMFARETAQPFDYNFAAWRELAVTKLVGDLVINFVAPGFSIYNQWSQVEGADGRLFENPAMRERYARGEAAAEALGALRAARRRIQGAEVNYHTEALSGRLYEDLEYAQSYLVLSPVVMLHTMEDVGLTLRSLGAVVRRAKVQRPVLTHAFDNIDDGARTLFEFSYDAHCLHTKLGVAHTDLHANNLTVYRWGLADLAPVATVGGGEPGYYDDPLVAYVAGARGEADTFVFPAAGTSGCLIDYSRAILGPAFAPRLGEGRTAQYAANFYRDQVNRAMRVLHRYAPEFVGRHQAALRAAVIADFGAVFPVLCAVDFMAIGMSAAETLAEEMTIIDPLEVRPFRVAREVVLLAQKLETVAREQFVTGLSRLVQKRGSAKAEFPGGRILEEVFGEWLFPRWAAREPRRAKTAQLVDAYNYNNEMEWSGSSYDEFPPWAKFDQIERHLGEYKIGAIFERGVEPFLEAIQTGSRIEVIAEQMRAEQERLDGKPVSVASSWIED